jgi:hypothetical protein
MPILTEDDRHLVALASSLRAGVRCERSKSKPSGYLIRTEIWFPQGAYQRVRDSAGKAIESKGIPFRRRYTKPDEISSILMMIEGMETINRDPKGIMTAREFNGRISNPKSHDDVLKTVIMLDEFHCSIN